MNDHEFLAQLRSDLLAAARRHDGAAVDEGAGHTDPDVPEATITAPTVRTPGRRWLAVAAAASILAVVGALFAFDSEPASAVIEVIRRDGFVQIRLVGLEHRVEDIEQAAAEVGLDLTVEEAPVGPSNVGKFVSLSSGAVPPELERTGTDGSTFQGFRIPDDWPHHVILTVGRPAEPGESWSVSSDALAPGELLECRDLLGDRVDDVERELSSEDLQLRWFSLGGSTPGEITDDIDDHRDWRVVQVLGAGDDDVWIEVTHDGSWPYPPGIPPATLDERC